MLATRYRVKNRVMDGVQVLFYDVIGPGNVPYRFTKDEFDRLAINNQIIDVRGQTSNGKIYVKGINGLKLKSLDTINIGKQSTVDMRFTIKNKIKFPNNRCIEGFIIEGYDGKTKVITSNEARKMALEGKLKNVRINRDKDAQILRGAGCNLADIPTITVTQEEFIARLKNQQLISR